MIKGL